MAWIIVNVGERDWCKLAYQFGHELGHVLANSWGPDAKPAPPCQWLEEALVEAFSLRGLGLLADSWERDPPFRADQAFAGSIRQYRADLLAHYVGYATAQGAVTDLPLWFREHRTMLEEADHDASRALVPALLPELARDASCIADLGALNRWPDRSALGLEAYLQAWSKSCKEIGSPGRLAMVVRELLLG